MLASGAEIEAAAKLVYRVLSPTPAIERERLRGRRVAVVLTGSNIDRDLFARILAEE